MNVSMMRQSTNGSHFCVVTYFLSKRSIPGVVISTSGKTSVMSASESVSAAVGGSWSHDWRVCLYASSTQPCRHTGCEPEVLTRLPRWSLARSGAPEVACHSQHLSLSRFLSAMMRLSPHNTVTGGTTHGRCTVH